MSFGIIRFAMFDRRLLLNFDWKILVLTLLIAIIGIVEIYSASYSPFPEEVVNQAGSNEFKKGNLDHGSESQNYWEKQVLWVGIGLIILFLITFLDYHSVVKYGYVFYSLSLILLILLFVIGDVRSGSRRWIDLGFFSIQPSEVIKLSIILALSKYFGESKKKDSYGLKELIVPLILVLIPFVLILLQPDLGTALSLFLISLCLIFSVGVKLKTSLYAGIFGIISCAVMWNFLKPYQKQRIFSFFNPYQDPLGSGYHTIQSEIAIGSGGFFGKGFLNGTQGQLKFLPEHHTDFIFSIIAEEWGFLGSLVFIILLMGLVFLCVQASFRAKDKIAALLCFGITVMISLNMLINIGMAVGLLPIVGVPLPLISYGGTSVITTMAGIGLILNVQMRKYLL